MEIEIERERQDQAHGGPANDDGYTFAGWMGLVAQYYQKAQRAAGAGRNEELRYRIIQMLALLVAFLQSWDRHHEVTDVDTTTPVNAAATRWSDTSQTSAKRTSRVKAGRILLVYNWLLEVGKGACFQAEKALVIKHESLSPVFGELWLAGAIRKSPEMVPTIGSRAHLYVPVPGIDPVEAVKRIRDILNAKAPNPEKDALRLRREEEDRLFFGVK